MSSDSFTSRRELTVGPRSFEYFALSALDHFDIARLPYALKILLENLLRHEDGESVTAADIEALATWDPSTAPNPRDRVLAGSHPAAGFHRRASSRRHGGHA